MKPLKFHPGAPALFLFISLSFLFLSSCNRRQEQKTAHIYSPKVVEAKGYVMSYDSIAEPTVVSAGKPRVVKAGKPKVVLTNTNVHPAGAPEVVMAGIPKISAPGKDSFLLPKTVTAIDSPFVAGIPEIVEARDAHAKDINPCNFSTFNTFEGLRHGIIQCIKQDRSGNLWFGTGGGGACRYDGKYFTHYTEKEGLSNPIVTDILQDKSGTFWFATWGGGVNRYDGKFMTHFTTKEGLSDDIVLTVFQDKRGDIWFGTLDEELNKYDGKTFTHYSKKEGMGHNATTGIIQDTSENLWFATWGGGVDCYNGKSFTHITEKEGLGNNKIRSIYMDDTGALWFGKNGGGLSRYDGKFFTNLSEKQGMRNSNITSIIQDKNKNFWLGTMSGGTMYDGHSFTDFTEKEGLSNYSHEIFQDRTGNFWFGGEGSGMSRWDGKIFTHFTKNEGLSDNRVLSILQDRSGILWFGTWAGGVNCYDGKSFKHYTQKEGFSNTMIVGITQVKNGDIWFSSGEGAICYNGTSFLHFTEEQGLPCNYVEKIIEDNIGNLWFVTDCGGVCRYDGKSFTHYTDRQGMSSNGVINGLQDKKGNLWFSAGRSGVNRFDGKSFTRFSEKEGLSNNMIVSLFEDKDGILWFGSRGGGVNRYDGKSFMIFTEKEGLCSNIVNSIIQDKSGNLWFGTASGLSMLSADYMLKLFKPINGLSTKQPVLFKNFTYEDGFLGTGCYSNALYEDNQGDIWIGATDRLTAYHPEGDEPDTIPPNAQLTRIQLFNENIPWLDLEKNRDTSFLLGNGVRFSNFMFDSISPWYYLPVNLSLAWNNNYLTFNFIGITLKRSKKVKYQYKLDGFDENWSAPASRTEAPYGNIPHGAYTFKVRAMNSEGYWSKEFNYTFTIRPPWWKTWWAYTGYILLFIAAIGAVIYSVIEFQRRKIRLIVHERNRIARELHDDIGAELNRITIVSQLLQKQTNKDDEKHEKLRYISEAGKKVLGSIGEIIWTMNPQKDNLDSLLAYIRRFVTEYLETNGIDVYIEFPDEIPANVVSEEYRRNLFLVVKEATSNISKYSKATSVRLSMNIRERMADFEISDNGTGFSVREKQYWGNGLRNMNQRMKDIGGDFQISSGQSQGTLIRLTFPVR
jgi:ligand-binding sensor domain-containing protein/two-component sensor histidine kinase